MKYRNFREFKIVRTCAKTYKTHTSYKQYLRNDFNNRCAYCNLPENLFTTTPFETDHFIPRAQFKGVKDYLETQYDNLVLSCKKCNDAKSDKYSGDITSDNPKNYQFYDPVEIDYNKIFYRTEYGSISSDDKKGLQMIDDLLLYRPIHNLAWICEETKKLIDKINKKVEEETNQSRKIVFQQAKDRLNDYFINCLGTFIANYNNKKFELDENDMVVEMDKLCTD